MFNTQKFLILPDRMLGIYLNQCGDLAHTTINKSMYNIILVRTRTCRYIAVKLGDTSSRVSGTFPVHNRVCRIKNIFRF